MGLSFRLSVIQRWRKKKRRRSQSLPEIPMDVVTEILTRLPSKTLMRFKCVSKLWSSLIHSPYLTSRFLTVPSQRIYICLSHYEDYRRSEILSLAPCATSPSSSFVVDHDLTIQNRGGQILQNLCGFMSHTFMKKLRMYNPTTRQLVTFPTIKLKPKTSAPDRSRWCYYFGHDPVNKQYKVLCSVGVPSMSSDHWVFDLKPGGSWKKVTLPPADFYPHLPLRQGLSLNGVIYYLAMIDWYNYVVVSFDIRSEEFKMIQVPLKEGDVRLHKAIEKVCLIEYGGKVTVFDHTYLEDKGTVNLWVLEDVRNKEWLGKTLVLQPCQLHLVKNVRLEVKGITQSGKVIMTPYNLFYKFYILCYDLQSNDMREIKIKGILYHWFPKKGEFLATQFSLMFMDESESVMYLKI
ncbi:F-box associated interaction domain [Arabidopsis thaliana x Arabidopsis arenosa]|uniref:F-box associated interaction domain n=1 Tax=Arabidopsis thaliana x Arabidopsis arenosa TaxID=1240361 RepID=A0A8T2CGY0_9BRAS|nr:F-box associated interaction domain [Arabidopsis thaliana x Arabidopsis arenosa]